MVRRFINASKIEMLKKKSYRRSASIHTAVACGVTWGHAAAWR
jgi:hypothetical protein